MAPWHVVSSLAHGVDARQPYVVWFVAAWLLYKRYCSVYVDLTVTRHHRLHDVTGSVHYTSAGAPILARHVGGARGPPITATVRYKNKIIQP